MNTFQLKELFDQDKFTKQQFQGVFPSNLLPETVAVYPSAFVANVDPSNKPGSHWVAFYFTKDQKGEFFDSYGQVPSIYSADFTKFLHNNTKMWTHNKKELQAMNSNVCGQYCLYFILKRCRGNSMYSIVYPFSKNKRINDAFVEEFVSSYFSIPDERSGPFTIFT